MENKSIYILNFSHFNEDSVKTTEQVIASQDKVVLCDKLAIKAKEFAEQVGLLETNKGKDIVSTAHFQVLEGKQKMYYWDLQVDCKTVAELFMTKLDMI